MDGETWLTSYYFAYLFCLAAALASAIKQHQAGLLVIVVARVFSVFAVVMVVLAGLPLLRKTDRSVAPRGSAR